jgi:ribosome maturation factor RimP
MKKTTNYGPMRGILHLNAGQVVELKQKRGQDPIEIAHDFKTILESLDGEEVTITIKKHEVIDEDE